MTEILPLITFEQLTKFLEIAVSSKTNELEIAAAKVLIMASRPPIFYKEEYKK